MIIILNQNQELVRQKLECVHLSFVNEDVLFMAEVWTSQNNTRFENKISYGKIGDFRKSDNEQS